MAAPVFTTAELKALLSAEQSAQDNLPVSSAARARSLVAIAALQELIERRERDELDATAHHLAYEFCLTAFDGCLDDVSEAAGAEGWRDLDNAATNYDPEEHLGYLERRGLIQRDARNPNWIAVLDESEAAL